MSQQDESQEITGEQIASARARLGVDQSWLAYRLGVSVAEVQKMENCGPLVVSMDKNTRHAIQKALESAGVMLAGGIKPVGV